ncbi:MAG: hypothetical protein Q7S87_09920 [Agitococcus sp.]|nr:hypothetical protein [Agitococcus sp.]
MVAYAESETTTEGVIFRCAPLELEVVQAEMSDYLLRLGIRSDWVTTTVTTGTQVQFTLATVAHDTNTLSLASQENYGIKNDIVMLPNKKGGLNAVSTVSQKEIVLALFQRGRVTTFEGAACSLATFKDHVGIRQNIVSWAQKLDWGWPNGGSARWNSAYWLKGTPNTAVSPFVALHDAFLQQHAYAIGCYTASKLVIAHAVSDYYRRIKRDPGLTRLVEQRLLSDGEPLVDIEPGKMWSFEQLCRASSDYSAQRLVAS